MDIEMNKSIYCCVFFFIWYNVMLLTPSGRYEKRSTTCVDVSGLVVVADSRGNSSLVHSRERKRLLTL